MKGFGTHCVDTISEVELDSYVRISVSQVELDCDSCPHVGAPTFPTAGWRTRGVGWRRPWSVYGFIDWGLV